MRMIVIKKLGISFALAILTGCTDGEQSSLERRKAELDQRERNLQAREAELARREAGLQPPPPPATDSLRMVSEGLAGNWEARMTCTETDCAGSAVGDTKTEEWRISYEPPALVARAWANGQLVRVYSGFFTGNTVELVERHADSSGQPAARMVARLSIVDSTRMDGQREIARENCKTIYSLQLNRQ